MKDNFDDILKRKLDEQHFAVDEIHRQEMIELLKGKKRRGVLPLWWLGSLVIVASLAGYFFVAKQATPQKANPSQHDEIRQTTPTAESQQTPAIANVESVDHSSSSMNSQESAPSEAASSQSAQHAGTNISSSVSTTSKKQSSFNSSSTANTSSTVNTSSSANTSSKVSIESTSDNNLTRNTQSISTQKNQAPTTEASGTKATSEPHGKELPTTSGTPSTYLVEGEILTNYTIVTQAVAVTIEDPDAYLQPEPEVIAENENSLLLFPEQRVTRHTAIVEALDMAGVEYTSSTGMNKIIPNTTFKKLLYLFGEAGVGMVLPSLPEYTSGWKFRGGAGLGYMLSPKVQLSWSAGYLLQAGGFDFERTSTINQPSFGTRSISNTLRPDKLHFVYTRIGMQYRLDRHLFGAHGGIQWLYGAQGTIVTQGLDQFASGTTETSTYSWVKTDGLRKLHWTADVSYGYQLTPRLIATAGTDIYFSPITVTDAALSAEGYYWDGAFAALHPFITLNYLIYGR
jgi:hypothetical protein